MNSLWKIKIININAKSELNFPQSNISGTNKNSKVFIVAIIMICVIAFIFDLNRLKIQIAIQISEKPINFVKIEAEALSNSKIRPTIS